MGRHHAWLPRSLIHSREIEISAWRWSAKIGPEFTGGERENIMNGAV